MRLCTKDAYEHMSSASSEIRIDRQFCKSATLVIFSPNPVSSSSDAHSHAPFPGIVLSLYAPFERSHFPCSTTEFQFELVTLTVHRRVDDQHLFSGGEGAVPHPSLDPRVHHENRFFAK